MGNFRRGRTSATEATLLKTLGFDPYSGFLHVPHRITALLSIGRQGGSSARGQAFVDIEMRLAFYYCKLIL